MTRVYFVRHAQPVHSWKDDSTRPLTKEGAEDTKKVLAFLKEKSIDRFYCSTYKRSIDTIKLAAEFYGMEIITDARLRERQKGEGRNDYGIIQKRWENLNYHEIGGESIQMVQDRNIAALKEIIQDNPDKNLVIGTHGTALSSILRYYDPSYNCDSFFRMIDWMPFIVELDFEGEKLVSKMEHLYVYKEFKGNRADR